MIDLVSLSLSLGSLIVEADFLLLKKFGLKRDDLFRLLLDVRSICLDNLRKFLVPFEEDINLGLQL